MQPRVSIVIPVYNVENYLQRCLQSVSNQSYRPLEVVLIDDGSTDSSLQICRDYKRTAPEGIEVKVISQANSGASLARKAGIKAASGKWITFIDSDDYVASEYVSALFEATERHNCPMAVCTFHPLKEGEKPKSICKISSRELSEKELFDRFFKYEFWGFWGGIYPKELFDKCLFPKQTVNEDYYVKAQLFMAHPRVAIVDPPLYFYEKHPGSLSSLAISERALGEFDNAVRTWQYTLENKPSLRFPALSIASEAACKWLGELSKTTDFSNTVYTAYRRRILAFLQQNLSTIMLNPHLLWKIKLVILKNISVTKIQTSIH